MRRGRPYGSASHQQGEPPHRPVCGALLLSLLPRSRQCRLCRAADEQRSRLHCNYVRMGRRDLLFRLFLFRSAEQSSARAVRGAPMDRPDHGDLGAAVRRHGTDLERMEFPRRPLSARRGRGRFFPGIILFLTYWFPSAYRARMVGRFMTAIPISAVIGAPLSGLILGMDGIWGLRGWQWLFICEGVPTVLLGLVVMFYLTDGPENASWLEADARAWLIDRLRRERMVREAHGKHTLWEALRHPRVLLLSLVYFGTAAAGYGLGFWLPTIVKEFGVSDLQTGFITAVPYTVGVATVVIWPLLSDRMQERKWNTALAFLVSAAGLALSTLFPDPVHKMAMLCIAAVGMFAIAPLFWTLPTAFLSGTAAAGGIALINSIGNLAGFAAPYAMGYLKDATGGFTAGLLAVAFFPFLSAILVLILGHNPALERGAIPEAAH